MLISGVITQGARHTPDFVDQYRVSYSVDGQRWDIYKENGEEKVIHVFVHMTQQHSVGMCNKCKYLALLYAINTPKK